MSLFKEPFNKIISGSLALRQDIMGKEVRTPQDIVYLNSKTAWIQLRSSVDVESNGTVRRNGLAVDNVLMGGALLAGNGQRNGIGTEGIGIYDTNTLNKSFNTLTPNVLGIRPMPGITNISIQSKSAYGSLRQATVNFQCWDIRQLETLEMLYMRPGYTVLLEWGWTPYAIPTKVNEYKLIQQISQDEKFFSRGNIDIQKYLGELRAKALDSHGNYDAMFGYIKNYSWKYRQDGGFDCTTEIISTGEILESLKINYSGASISANSSGTLLSNIGYSKIEEIQKEYRRNALAGLVAETYALVLSNQEDDGVGKVAYTANNGKTGTIYYAKKEIELKSDTTTDEGKEATEGYVTDDDSNIYITLRSFVELLNNFILLENPDASGPNKNIVKLSVDDRPESVDAGKSLRCLFNPLQISVDPRICILKNPLFEKLIQGINIIENNQPIEVINTIPAKETIQQYEPIVKQLKDIRGKSGSFQDFKNVLLKINTKEKLAGISDYYYTKYNEKFYDFLTSGGFTSSDLNDDDLVDVFEGLNITFKDVIYYENDIARAYTEFKQKWSENESYRFTGSFVKPTIIRAFLDATPTERKSRAIESAKNKTAEQQETLNEIKKDINSSKDGYLSICNKLQQSYHTNDVNSQYGVHANIFLNLRLLYNLAGSESLEGQDPSEHQSISLMSYMKELLTSVQNSIGNVNNFEIIIDGNVGYITDVNQVPSNKPEPFIFEIGSKRSVIRNISLESQIFSDQSTIIAIAAQSDAGKLGLENTSMIAYNTGIKDRNIFRKDTPINKNHSEEDQLSGFILALKDLSELFDSLEKGLNYFDSELKVDSVNKYKKSLTDIIAFFTSQYKTENKYKSILPTKLSLTTDGIGGLIIGNIFDIDKTFTPKAYKGDGNTGINLQYLVTNIKQEVGANNQWTTTIQGQPFIPDVSYDKLTKNQSPINAKLSITKKYVYDQSTGTIKEQIINDGSVNEPPPGIIGDARSMAAAMNYTLGGPKKGDHACNRYTYHIARNYVLFKAGKGKQAVKGVEVGASGGNAATPTALAFYEKLGYKNYTIGTNLTKVQMEAYLSDINKWNVGEVASYIGGSGNPYHAQIYTGGMGWDSSSRSFIPIPKSPRWATDDSENYRWKGGAGHFVYNSSSQNSYTLYHSKLS